MARTFSASQLPKVLRMWGALSFFTCKCASRHNGVHFLIPHLATWLRTRRFSEPTFRPSGATNHWKNNEKHSESWLFYLFGHLHLLLLSPDLLSSFLSTSAFHLSILSEVWLQNFLRWFLSRSMSQYWSWSNIFNDYQPLAIVWLRFLCPAVPTHCLFHLLSLLALAFLLAQVQKWMVGWASPILRAAH